MKLEEKGCRVVFENSCVKIFKGSNVMTGYLVGKLYVIKLHLLKEQANAVGACNSLMHRRMGHSALYPVGICEICLKGKQTKLSFLSIPEDWKASRILQHVSTDVCGKISPPTYDNYSYFVTFIDHYSNFCATYLLRKKSKVFEKFQIYVAMVEAKFGARVQNLRCDRGGEYVSAKFVDFCQTKGITISYSMPWNPLQNGKAERMNRTLLEKARCLWALPLLDSKLDKSMWGEALMTATYLTNRLGTSVLPKGLSPAERWYGFEPNLKKIRIFGSPAYALIHKEDRNKPSGRSKKLFLVVYNGYRLWNPETKKIEYGRNVIFDESVESGISESEDEPKHINVYPEECIPEDQRKSPTPQDKRKSLIPLTSDVMEDIGGDSDSESIFRDFPDETTGYPEKDRKSTRKRVKPKYLDDFVINFALNEMALSTNAEIDVPQTFSNVTHDPDWQQAINEELTSLESNKTWEEVDAPPDLTPIDCKWVFTIKTSNGESKKKALSGSRFLTS